MLLFTVEEGDIVWAKLRNFPFWPAVVSGILLITYVQKLYKCVCPPQQAVKSPPGLFEICYACSMCFNIIIIK